MQDNKIRYPRLSRRIQAILLDSFVVPVSALGALILVSQFTEQGIYSAIAACLVIFILEPLLVSTTGGSLGHHVFGIRVINKNHGGNINIFSALIRFIAKIILGFFSLVIYFTTTKYQAIHDYLAGSIVVIKHPERFDDFEALKKRVIEQPGYLYPSKFRRVILIAVYNLLLLFLITQLSSLFMSELCSLFYQCSEMERWLTFGLQIIWLSGLVAIILLGWNGLLPGCHRQLKSK